VFGKECNFKKTPETFLTLVLPLLQLIVFKQSAAFKISGE